MGFKYESATLNSVLSFRVTEDSPQFLLDILICMIRNEILSKHDLYAQFKTEYCMQVYEKIRRRSVIFGCILQHTQSSDNIFCWWMNFMNPVEHDDVLLFNAMLKKHARVKSLWKSAIVSSIVSLNEVRVKKRRDKIYEVFVSRTHIHNV